MGVPVERDRPRGRAGPALQLTIQARRVAKELPRASEERLASNKVLEALNTPCPNCASQMVSDMGDLSTTDDLLYLLGQNTNYNRLRKTF